MTTPPTPEPSDSDIKLATALYDEAYHYGDITKYLECVKWLVSSHVAARLREEREKPGWLLFSQRELPKVIADRDQLKAELAAAQTLSSQWADKANEVKRDHAITLEAAKRNSEGWAAEQQAHEATKRELEQCQTLCTQWADKNSETRQQLTACREELTKLTGFYDEIVKEIGHDQIITEHRKRGELLRQETRWRKEAESSLAALEAQKRELIQALEAAADETGIRSARAHAAEMLRRIDAKHGGVG